MRGLQCRRLLTLSLVVLVIATSTLAAQTYSVLYNFGTNSGDPLDPTYSGIVAQGRDGNLYSTTPYACGAAFKITPSGKLTTLFGFTSPYGCGPASGLTLGTDGNFYGAAISGTIYGYGDIFTITPSGSVVQLYSFIEDSDGANPYAPPVQGTDGNFYGTTTQGGNDAACGGCGAVYKVTPTGTFTVLYRFDSTHGSAPYAPLVQGPDGNFYGTTRYGGTNDDGVVFKITPAGKLTVLYNFDGAHGEFPTSPVVQDSDGNFYGTTTVGGASGNGVVFKITPAGNLTVLHSMNGSTDGYSPFAGLVQATDGNFYGANTYGGKPTVRCLDGCGTIFKITPKGEFTVLHRFRFPAGAEPQVTLFQHTNGTLYGDAMCGGTGTGAAWACYSTGGVFYSLNIGLKPFVSLLPYSGKVGKTIEFLGQGFKRTKNVSFNGTAASVKVVSDTYLTATVPNGATTGFVIVTTAKGKLKSNKKFRVIP